MHNEEIAEGEGCQAEEKKNRVSLCFIGNFKVWKKKLYLDEHRRCNDGDASICWVQSGLHWSHVST